MRYNNSITARGSQDARLVGGFQHSPQHSVIGSQAPIRSLEDISARAADMRRQVMAIMDTWNPQERVQRSKDKAQELKLLYEYGHLGVEKESESEGL